jgi:serine protein kinase
MAESGEKLLKSIYETSKTEFASNRTVLSFQEYLEDVLARPEIHIRNAACYLADMVDHFGETRISRPTGEFTRYNLFDLEGAEYGRVVGQERVQESLIRLLMNFVRSGQIDRLAMLHGPNGSAKTSLIQAISRAAEAYSRLPEGVLYRFNWVFPVQGSRRGSLGFGNQTSNNTYDTYAYLEQDEIEARLPCEFKDHPLLLLSVDQREALFDSLPGYQEESQERTVPRSLREGNLSAKNRTIFDALMVNYRGDAQSVLQHIQVERFYLSRRYRTGLIAVEPQMSVDAYARQITADRTLGMLPPSLQHLTLYETGGPLNEANRGILEFNDLLKRPLETWKYLLVAAEQAQASVESVSMFLDVVMFASSNDVHLNAFKEHPDWAAFKGRIELVTTPYLKRVSDELEVYRSQVPKSLPGTHIAPHALMVAARWAVLTRLEPPDPESYDEGVRKLVKELTPEEKLELYDRGHVPERLSQKERKDMRQIASQIFDEFQFSDEYEGRSGASVREVRMAIMNAAQDSRFDHLSPEAVLDQLRLLCTEKSSYSFLRRDASRGYRDALGFIDSVEEYYYEVLGEEVRAAMGLVEAGSHRALFERYLLHISAWTKKETLIDPVLGKKMSPDEDLMKDVEKALMSSGEDSSDFRRSIISQIGAMKLENPNVVVDYETLFSPYFTKLKERYFEENRSVVEKLQSNFLKYLNDDTKSLDKRSLEQVKAFHENLTQIGYNASSVRHAISSLLAFRSRQ